jgi:hypothetical protein
MPSNRNVAPLIGAGQQFTATTTPEKIFEENLDRSFLAISNNGTNAVYFGFGSGAYATPAAGWTLAAGATFNPVVAPGDAIFVATGTSTSTISILEG